MNETFSVAVIIPTYNGVNDLHRLLDSLDSQTLQFDLLIVDSGSVDGTAELARKRSRYFKSIATKDFNHGGTRQQMVQDAPGYDIYVFLTQDAYLENASSLQHLIQPFSDDARVGAVCGRQLPHLDATPLAQHARQFNYPATSHITQYDASGKNGLKTAFMSNSFAAYRRDALLEAGGFPEHVILSEDMFVTAQMLLKGWKIAYAAQAECRHSHNYTVLEEFRRYFDIGVFHARESWIREKFGGAGGEGLRYVESELKFLGLKRLHLWPSSLWRNACKLIGYKLGQNEHRLPGAIKKNLSMHRRYWNARETRART